MEEIEEILKKELIFYKVIIAQKEIFYKKQ